MSDYESIFSDKVTEVDEYIGNYWGPGAADPHPGVPRLIESVRYSSLHGGKRFRPVLSLLTAQALKQPEARVMAFAASIEFVHTYSLVHDDLPCMDNDDWRRGRPTNHKVYGETVALLAGDALLTEAFFLIVQSYVDNPALACKLVQLLSDAAGVRGMVGGQATDMLAKAETLTREELESMHNMKTGALITSAVDGAAFICGATPDQHEALKGYAARLGLAFQVADDVLDSHKDRLEPGSFPALIGLDSTQQFLTQLTDEALAQLDNFGPEAEGLRWIARFNLTRTS